MSTTTDAVNDLFRRHPEYLPVAIGALEYLKANPEALKVLADSAAQVQANPVLLDLVLRELQLRLPQPAATLPNLVVDGHVFALANGQPFTVRECSDFNLLARYLREGAEAIRPVLQQRKDCGFNMLRVWTLMDLEQFGIGKLLPEEFGDFYAHIPDFVALCASYGLYVEFTAYTGINDPEHWTKLGAAAQRCPTRPLLEWVNEYDQNANHSVPDYKGRTLPLDGFEPIPGVICSHGSNGSGEGPVEPFWGYLTFHTNLEPEEQRKAGHNAMEIDGIDRHCVLTNERPRYDDNEQSYQKSYDAGAGSALLNAGLCFHSIDGKRSQLWATDGVQHRGALGMCAGSWSVRLGAATSGPYVHDDECLKLENQPQKPDGTPNPDHDPARTTYLRVYRRGVTFVFIR